MEENKLGYKNIYYPPGGILLWIIILLELITFGLTLVAMVIISKSNVELLTLYSKLIRKICPFVNYFSPRVAESIIKKQTQSLTKVQNAV